MKLCIIYTGGTIGCIGKPLAPMPPVAFQQAFDRLIAPIIQTKYPNCQAVFGEVENVLDSTNIQPSDWCAIASVIIDNYLNYDAFLVLHGTDTLAWTASALSFLLTGLKFSWPEFYFLSFLYSLIKVLSSRLEVISMSLSDKK